MVAAIDDFKEGEVSMSAAATRFSELRKTPDDKIMGRVKRDSKPGIATVLSSIVEDAL